MTNVLPLRIKWKEFLLRLLTDFLTRIIVILTFSFKILSGNRKNKFFMIKFFDATTEEIEIDWRYQTIALFHFPYISCMSCAPLRGKVSERYGKQKSSVNDAGETIRHDWRQTWICHFPHSPNPQPTYNALISPWRHFSNFLSVVNKENFSLLISKKISNFND